MADTQTIDQQLHQLSRQVTGDGVALCQDTPLFEINSAGDWFYLSSPLPVKFAKLFASVLHCIEGEYFLITPVEKVKVSVARYAIVIVDYKLTQDNGLILQSSIETEHVISDKSQVTLLEDAIVFPIERGVTAGLGRACYYRYINQFVTD